MSDLAHRAYSHDPAWASAPIWRSEFRNIVVRYVREGRLAANHAQEILHAAEDKMHPRQYNIDSQVVLELALQTGLSAYQCEYLALAQDLNVPLVTTQFELVKAAPQMAILLPDFVENRA
ncbi:type II toxin-antitoxin system VapC family toxin [Cerasicoccus maritimus]|uniref:type II toxin-antitoxin system VapC family toxin n=1 Tax=Cerasicoccus maritimus TaxID=490089 RepID=UPI002852B803|nr:type II toxin-antitoxin system VapC family toxin [Cerasicoccus maritimus]